MKRLVNIAKQALPGPIRKILGKHFGPVLLPYRPPIAPLTLDGTALICIDMINETIDGIIKPEDFLANMHGLVTHCRKAGLPIIHSKSQHSISDRSDWTLCMLDNPETTGFIEGTRKNEWIDGFDPLPEDSVVLRTRYSVFFNTDILALLEDQGVTQLIIAGTHTEYCIHCSVMDAYSNNFPVYVLPECSASHNRRFHKSTFEFFSQHKFINTVSLDFVKKSLTLDSNQL